MTAAFESMKLGTDVYSPAKTSTALSSQVLVARPNAEVGASHVVACLATREL